MYFHQPYFTELLSAVKKQLLDQKHFFVTQTEQIFFVVVVNLLNEQICIEITTTSNERKQIDNGVYKYFINICSLPIYRFLYTRHNNFWDIAQNGTHSCYIWHKNKKRTNKHSKSMNNLSMLCKKKTLFYIAALKIQ